MPTENLFLNTLAFKFPKDPVTLIISVKTTQAFRR